LANIPDRVNQASIKFCNLRIIQPN